MGEEGRPQGVGKWGMMARGVKGGDGREERPVPPIMAMGMGSVGVSLGRGGEGGWERTWVGGWEVGGGHFGGRD